MTLKYLDALNEFGLSGSNGASEVEVQGALLAIDDPNSQHINMALTGAIPSLANGIPRPRSSMVGQDFSEEPLLIYRCSTAL